MSEQGVNPENVVYDRPKNPYTDRGEMIDAGNDFIVFDFDEDHVVKYPNGDRISDPPYDNLSPDFYQQLVEDNSKIAGIMGDNLAETVFFPPNEQLHSNYRLVQQKFDKNEFLSYLSLEELRQFIIDHKLEFAIVLEKAKKVEEVFGVPLDLTPRNIVYHEGKLLVTENDCPSLRYEHREKMQDKIDKDRQTMSFVEKLIK